MPDLRFETERRQLRGLVLYVAVLALAAAVLTVAWLSGRAGSRGAWAIGLDLGAVLGLSTCVSYARAFSELTPTGIRTRGLAGVRSAEWSRVREVVRSPHGRTTSVMVIRTDGSTFRLGAPVDGGVMPDARFAEKMEEIRRYVAQQVPAAGGSEVSNPSEG